MYYRLSLLILLFFLYGNTSHGQRINYTISKNDSAIVFLTMGYYRDAKMTFFLGSNIVLNNKFYPLSGANRISRIYKYAVSDPNNDEFIKIVDTINYYITDSKLMADTLVSNIDTQYIVGGETYHILENSFLKYPHNNNFDFFYIIFNVKADLITLYENPDIDFYLLPGDENSVTYNYTNNSASPTIVIMKMIDEWPLCEKQRNYFKAFRILDMNYEFSWK